MRLCRVVFIGQVSGQMAAGAGAEGNETVCQGSAPLVQITAPLVSLWKRILLFVSAAAFRGQKESEGKKARAPLSRTAQQKAAGIRSELGATSDGRNGKCSFSLVAAVFSTLANKGGNDRAITQTKKHLFTCIPALSFFFFPPFFLLLHLSEAALCDVTKGASDASARSH